MSYLSDFEHTKLDAQVFPGCVVQKHYISSAISGQRRVPITKVWKVEKLLGKGTFGEVRLEACSPERTNTNEKREERAVKRIWTTGTEFKRSYERELKALLEFSKPKYKESAVFVEFLGWFEDLESVYLAMEYLPLGDLEDNVLAVGGSIKEEGVREIAVQVLEGLRIMHLENFAHRDLKPKNVLVCQGPPNWWVKLADFGLSKCRTDETGFRTQTGTFAYMAPELLNYIPDIDPETSEYTNAVDMWALGCIVYRLVCGIVPFPPGPSLVKFCVDGSAFPPKLEELTGLGQSFVKGLIVPYPSRRLTAQQALDHPWTQSGLETLNFESQSISFGGYDTATHPGLQSHEPATTTLIVDSGAAARGMPRTYHPPTVEDEKEETGSDTGSESDEVEEPESMMRPSPTKLKSSKKNQGGPSDREEQNKRSPQAPSDPYINIVEPPAPSPAQPKKPSLQSYISRSQSPSPPPRKAPARSRTQCGDPYIVEPPPPRPSVLTKPSLQVDSSGKPPLATRKEPTRSKTQDYPRNKVVPPLPRAQTFRPVDQVPPMRRAETYTSARMPPLPRAATFQAADRRPSRLREDYSSVGSDSDDSWFYEKPAPSHNPAPGRSEKSRQDPEWSESEESGGGVSDYSQRGSDPGELSDASNFGVPSESSHQVDPMPIYTPAQAYTNARNEFSKGIPPTQEMLNILKKAKRGTSSTHVRGNAPIEAPAYAPATRNATRRGIEKVEEWIKYQPGITPREGMGIPFEQPDPSPSSGQASGSLAMDKNRPAYYADEKGFIEVASRPSPRHHTRHTSTGDGLRLPRAHARHVSTGDAHGVPPNTFSPRYNSSGLYATANGTRAPEYVHIDPVLHREETRPIPSASALRARGRAEGHYPANEDLVYRYYAQRDKADKWLRNNPQAIGTEQEKYHIRKRDEAHQWLSDWWRPERRPWGNEYGEKEVRHEGTVSYKDGVSDGYDSGW